MAFVVKWVTSPVKIACQVTTGNFEGAGDTVKDLVVSTPVVSHAAAGGLLVVGEQEAAANLWQHSNKNLNDITNSIPVVGHAKGLVHYVCDDAAGGQEAMEKANRTTMAIGNGVGELVAIVPKAAATVVVAGAEMTTEAVKTIHPNSSSWDTWDNDI